MKRRSWEAPSLLVIAMVIVMVVLPFYAFPILLLITARDVTGWVLPLSMMTIPLLIALEASERPWVEALAWGLSGLVTMAILVDLFLKDARVGALLLLAFPLGMVAGWVAMKLSEGMGEVGHEVTRRLVVILFSVAANALVFAAVWIWRVAQG
jgi:hypothetical protein